PDAGRITENEVRIGQTGRPGIGVRPARVLAGKPYKARAAVVPRIEDIRLNAHELASHLHHVASTNEREIVGVMECVADVITKSSDILVAEIAGETSGEVERHQTGEAGIPVRNPEFLLEISGIARIAAVGEDAPG